MIHGGATQIAGVLGWPVAHSLSPRLHGYWLRQYAIDGAYLPFPVRPEDFPGAVRGLACCRLRGANITVPHKQTAFDVCDDVAESARRAGAVNTLVFAGERITGSNTDGAGFLACLREQQVEPRDGPALILGAGGAARAIAAALLDEGVEVSVCSRRPDQAIALAQALDGVRVAPWPVGYSLHEHRLLVNATSGGMHGVGPLDMTLVDPSPDLVVADIVYAPRRTALLDQASRLGLQTVEGIGMLLHQAVPGFAAWFGVVPTVTAALRDFVLAV